MGNWRVRAEIGVLAAAAVVALGLPCALAQGSAALVSQGGEGNGAVRAARLSFVQGTVTVQGAAVGGSVPAQLNMPLVSGAQILTGQDGEAEVEFEDGSLVRLTPQSSVSLDGLAAEADGNPSTAVTVQGGLVYAELRAAPQERYTLRAEGEALSPIENLTVRVNFDQPPASFAVLSGTAGVSDASGGSARELKAGETLSADALGAGGYTVTAGVAGESWDAWNADRDQMEAAEAVDRTDVRNGYAGEQGYGWSDLDAYGTWYDVPGQGEVWQPAVAEETAGWDPYGDGAWMWYPTMGYVWSSGYPWGWTPYRCGDWSYYGGFGWGWSPGGCGGGLGWVFLGAGRPVNIAGAPGWYKVPHAPNRPPGPVHPILPTRNEPGMAGGGNAALAGATGWGTALVHGPRQINGMLATPVPRGSAAVLNGNLPLRTGLDRDFPVDRNSHAAVTGRVATGPAVVVPSRSIVGSAGGQGYTGQSGAAVFRGQQAPDTGVRAPGSGAGAGQARPGSAPGQRTQPAARSFERPMGAPPRPTYVPPPPRPAAPPPPPAPRSAPAAHPAK